MIQCKARSATLRLSVLVIAAGAPVALACGTDSGSHGEGAGDSTSTSGGSPTYGGSGGMPSTGGTGGSPLSTGGQGGAPAHPTAGSSGSGGDAGGGTAGSSGSSGALGSGATGGASGASGAGGSSGSSGTGGSAGNHNTSQCDVPDPGPAPATTFVVGDGTPASCTAALIQQGLDAEATVTFDCGSDPVAIPVTETLWVRSNESAAIHGGGLVTLDGQDSVNIIELEGRSSLQVRDLRFINGFGQKWGGAIGAGYLATVEVFDCVFEDNHLTGNNALDNHPGGGAIGGGHMNAVVARSTFLRNSCDGDCYGGGAFYSLLGDSKIYDSWFEDNVGEGAFGGAVYIENGPCCDEYVDNATLWCGVTFLNNSGVGRGGAISIYWTRTTIDSCHFEGNTSELWGGALSLSTADNTMNSGMDISGLGTQVVRNSSFRDNSGPKGAAIWATGTQSVLIENSTFTDHHRDGNGVVFLANAPLEIRARYSTFADSALPAFAQNASASGQNALEHSIVANNGSGDGRVQCSNVLEWPSANDACTSDSTAADPLLGTLTAASGLWYFPLGAGSAALGQGSDCPATDQLGTTRGSTCDLGAIEQP